MTRVAPISALAAIAAQIGYPLTHGQARDAITVAVVVLLAAACVAHAAAARGVWFATWYTVVTAGVGLTAEMIGSTTGFPFGCYDYATGRIGPSVAGVPLVVALAWTAGVYPVWVVVTLLFRGSVPRVSMTAAGVVGWDLYLDPQMVADGQWRWCSTTRGLPGLEQIPYTNYVGWFAVALLMAAAVTVLARFARPPTGTAVVPVVLFVWTWLGSALAHAVFLEAHELRYSAVYGLVGMGVLGVPLVVRGIVRG